MYEFNNFVFEKHLTITNSILGTTFFTLTGTHGCHVAVGVFWLMLMYIRTFQPRDTTRDHRWFLRNALHILAFIATILLGMRLVLGVVRGMEATGVNVGTMAHIAKAYFAWRSSGLVVSLGALPPLARPAPAALRSASTSPTRSTSR